MTLRSQLVTLPLLVLAIAWPSALSHSCGPTGEVMKSYTFLNPKIVEREKGFTPYFMSFSYLYRNYYEAQQKQKKQTNLEEWRERICREATLEDIEQVIYHSSTGLLRLLHRSVLNEDRPIPMPLQKNSFARFLVYTGCPEASGYLEYAKRCEPHVLRGDGWEAPNRNIERMNDLIEEGQQTFLQTESHYIRLRYAYQIIRLAHYAGQFERVEALWDYLLPKVDRRKPSILYYWTLSHLAGAKKALGKRAEAAHLFATVFKNCPGMRPTAYQSFGVKDDAEWRAAWLKCEDDEERTALYAMRAAQKNSKIVAEMEEIYETDPDSEYLDLLLVREMRRLERELLGIRFDEGRKRSSRYFKIPREKAGSYTIDLQEFTRKILKDRQALNLSLWKIAEGYLEVLAGDYYSARKTFQRVRDQVENPTLREQLQVFEMVLEIAAWTEINEEVELKAYAYMNDEPLFKKYPDFEAFLRTKLAFLYKQNLSPGKAFLMEHQVSDLKYHPEMTLLNDLIALAEKVNHNRFERLLIEDEEGQNIEYELLDIKGALLMGEFQLEAANEVFKKIPRTERERFGTFNPFQERLRPCIHCPRRVVDTLEYTRPDLVNRLLDLEYQARADREKSAAYYYLLGIGFYNLSYYGYSWNALDFFRSGSSWGYRNPENVYPHYQAPEGNKEYKDLSRALSYFETARVIAHTTQPELAARATFMAARCRQKEYFNSPDFKQPRYGYIPELPPKYMDYYKVLFEQYAETAFMKEVIKECQYVRAYAGL